MSKHFGPGLKNTSVECKCPDCGAVVSRLIARKCRKKCYSSVECNTVLGDSKSLTITLLEGDHITIPYDPQMTVNQLKKEIETVTHVPPNKQLLVVDGQALKAFDVKFRQMTLFEQNVKGGSSIQLLLLKYTVYAGQTTIDGAPKDIYGNASGNQYDLVADGTFKGMKILIMQFYQFDLVPVVNALKAKGFEITILSILPGVIEFQKLLDASCQLWVISSSTVNITGEYLQAIEFFFESGKGLYLWGDNDPYYADANVISRKLWGIEQHGNLPGGVIVHAQESPDIENLAATSKKGFFPHLITTGLEFLFEGITISTIQITSSSNLQPLVRGSAGNLLTVVYDYDGKRAVIDGGFTRLYCQWDGAGTGRYVKNAAAWLVNYERFYATYQ